MVSLFGGGFCCYTDCVLVYRLLDLIFCFVFMMFCLVWVWCYVCVLIAFGCFGFWLFGCLIYYLLFRWWMLIWVLRFVVVGVIWCIWLNFLFWLLLFVCLIVFIFFGVIKSVVDMDAVCFELIDLFWIIVWLVLGCL